MGKKILLYTLAGLAAFLVLAQLVPYGRDHTNPAVVREPDWDSQRTRELVVRACYDCHSYETEWSWYSNVAPMSWLIQYDVDAGRGELNFSEWGGRREESVVGEFSEGGMPQWYYVILHPSAKLSSGERQELIEGLQLSGM